MDVDQLANVLRSKSLCADPVTGAASPCRIPLAMTGGIEMCPAPGLVTDLRPGSGSILAVGSQVDDPSVAWGFR